MAQTQETTAPRDARSFEDHVIGTLADFPEGSHTVIELKGRQVGIFNIRGELHGLPNICPHQTGPLCTGKIVTGSLRSDAETGWKPEWVHDGEVVVCPWHGLEYHIPSGRCLAFQHIKLRRYDVRVDGDDVIVRTAARRR